jgi:hypothetical protein
VGQVRCNLVSACARGLLDVLPGRCVQQPAPFSTKASRVETGGGLAHLEPPCEASARATWAGHSAGCPVAPATQSPGAAPFTIQSGRRLRLRWVRFSLPMSNVPNIAVGFLRCGIASLESPLIATKCRARGAHVPAGTLCLRVGKGGSECNGLIYKRGCQENTSPSTGRRGFPRHPAPSQLWKTLVWCRAPGLVLRCSISAAASSISSDGAHRF